MSNGSVKQYIDYFVTVFHFICIFYGLYVDKFAFLYAF